MYIERQNKIRIYNKLNIDDKKQEPAVESSALDQMGVLLCTRRSEPFVYNKAIYMRKLNNHETMLSNLVFKNVDRTTGW